MTRPGKHDFQPAGQAADSQICAGERDLRSDLPAFVAAAPTMS